MNPYKYTYKFRDNDNLWEIALTSPITMTIFISRGNDFFLSRKNTQDFESWLMSLENHLVDAMEYALKSQSGEELSSEGGVQPEGVYIKKWNDYTIWLAMRLSKHRKVGVHIVNSKPVSVYCDSP